MTKLSNWLILISLYFNYLLVDVQSREVVYDGYKVFRVHTETLEQLRHLKRLTEVEDKSLKINFWSEANRINSTSDLMVSPDVIDELKFYFEKENIKTETLISDVGRILETQKYDENSLFYAKAPNDTVFFQRYQSLSNIYQYLDDLARYGDDLCTLEVIGKSSEGRAIKIIKIGYPNETNPEKPIVWIDAGIHAREWIAPASALFIANKLVNDKDNEIMSLLKTFDFHILPSANPDGYEYSRNFDRFWRKTRSRHRSSLLGLFCVGVDPNRNYDYQWRKSGSSGNPCSNVYHGPHPLSEPETKAIAEHIQKNKDRVKLFISLHSYSQLILTPWGWTNDVPKSYPDMLRVAEIGARALKMRYGTEYEYGSSRSILYLASGGSDDWAHGVAKIKYSYTFELRDKGNYGFLLPARYIKPTGEETFDGLVSMLQEIKKELS